MLFRITRLRNELLYLGLVCSEVLNANNLAEYSDANLIFELDGVGEIYEPYNLKDQI